MRHSFRVQTIIISSLILVVAPLVTSAQGAIEGTITFWGDPGGGTQIEVGAHSSLGGPPDETVLVAMPGGAYSIPVSDGVYYVATYMSRDGYVGEPRTEDVLVWYDADGDGNRDTVTVSGGAVTGVDVDLGFVYVDIDATGGANNGSSWTDAFTGLQDGINLAVSGIEVWVAEGTYVPGASRSDSFLPKIGVRVFGGFVGTETIRRQRDWNAHPTILSGEIGGSAATDNCYHVVLADASTPTAMLNGITITRGYADGDHALFDDEGGGVRARSGGVTLANTTILDNYSSQNGGGVVTYSPGYVIAVNSSFIDNESVLYGGGFWIHAASPVPSMAVNCVFTGNHAFRGAAITVQGQVWIAGSEPVIVNVSVSQNDALIEAGGIYTNTSTAIPPDAPVRIENSIIWGNTAPAFPQLSYYTASSIPPVVNHSIVQGGWAHSGTHILTDDPSFADAELRINLDSPAIDAGDNYAVPIDVHDVDENHWTDDPIDRDRDFNYRYKEIPYVPNTGVADPGSAAIDMGAYEAFDPALIFFSGFESGDADDWDNVVGGQ